MNPDLLAIAVIGIVAGSALFGFWLLVRLIVRSVFPGDPVHYDYDHEG